MDRLLTIQTFAKVVQRASYTAAADDLGISRALVSRHISDLEAYCGVRLLNRTTRSVTRTEAGEHYYEFCKRILSAIQAEEETLTKLKTDIEGKISIVAPKWVGNLDIAAAIIEFSKLNPKVNVHLTLGGVSAKTYEFLERGFDICIQNKHIRDSQVRVKKIVDVASVAVAAPEYLAAHGTPVHPNDLEKFDCLVHAGEPLWRFNDGAKSRHVKVPERFNCNSYSVLCSAAIAGLGIAHLPVPLSERHIQAGTLRPILTNYPFDKRPLYAAYTPGDHIPRKVRSLLTFLGNWFQRHPLSDLKTDIGMVPDMPDHRQLVTKQMTKQSNHWQSTGAAN